MNLFKAFESRVSGAFGDAPQGHVSPLPFRKLAKSAAKQMEAETFVVDGVDTAPALYTVLVSPADDVALRPHYPQLTQELVSFIESQARGKNYVFVGEPLARFLVDPALRSGKYAVFAENIDAETLERLRAEERDFLSGSSAVGGAAADRLSSHGRRRPTRRADHGAPHAAPAGAHAARGAHAAPAEPIAPAPSPVDDGLLPLPTAADIASPAEDHAAAAFDIAAVPVISAFQAAANVPSVDDIPDPLADSPADLAPSEPIEPEVPASPLPLDDSASLGLDIVPVDFLDSNVSASSLSVPKIDVPVTQRRIPAVEAPAPEEDFPAGISEPVVPSFLLVDHQTGRTYHGSAPATVIGRERMRSNIVLADPNVSRRHAEVFFDEASRAWYLRDLGSTNGTLVNDVDVSQCKLHDGDLLTIGLMNLEFREAS